MSITLYKNCLIEMDKIEKKSVDCIFADLPYGLTKNNWDIPIDIDKMWVQFKRIIKKGVNHDYSCRTIHIKNSKFTGKYV